MPDGASRAVVAAGIGKETTTTGGNKMKANIEELANFK